MTVTVSPPDAGDVTIDPEEAEYEDGATVTLSAPSNRGCLLHRWSGDIDTEEASVGLVVDD